MSNEHSARNPPFPKILFAFRVDSMTSQWLTSHMSKTATTTKAFRVLGTTDHVTVCYLCGRDELRGTIALEVLDADGTGTGTVVYYGSSCGAKAAGWTQKDFNAAVKTADQAKIEAARIAREEESNRYCTARDAWSQTTYGCDIWSVRGTNGKRRPFFDIVKEFDAAVAAGTAAI